MKRTFSQITKDPEANQKAEANKVLYGAEEKRKKLDTQKIGDFIVNARDAIHFKIVSTSEEVNADESEAFFEPKFLYWLLGDEERIQGYENLSITICLSSKRLIPYMTIAYERKANEVSLFAQIDDIEAMIKKHYGTVYTDKELFVKEVLEYEKQTWAIPGKQFTTLDKSGVPEYTIQRVQLSDTTFHEQNFFTQALLPFFIEGATQVEPSQYWNYFLVYVAGTHELVGLATVYQAHLTADQFRMKTSQVLVLPPFQRRGIASRLYSAIYDDYRHKQPHCFEVMTEDAADEFQKVQDIVHSKAMVTALREESKELKDVGIKPYPARINQASQIKDCQFSKAQTLYLSKLLKLPTRVILQINDLIVYSKLDSKNEAIMREYRLTIKRRLYIRCMNAYPELFTGARERLSTKTGGLKAPYIFNELLEDDQFAQKTGQDEAGQVADKQQEQQMKLLTEEASRIQLRNMYDETCKMFDQLKSKIAQLS